MTGADQTCYVKLHNSSGLQTSVRSSNGNQSLTMIGSTESHKQRWDSHGAQITPTWCSNTLLLKPRILIRATKRPLRQTQPAPMPKPGTTQRLASLSAVDSTPKMDAHMVKNATLFTNAKHASSNIAMLTTLILRTLSPRPNQQTRKKTQQSSEWYWLQYPTPP